MTGEALRGAVRDVGAVLLAWSGFAAAETLVVARSAGRLSDAGEVGLVPTLVMPVALAMLLPAAVAVVALGRLAYAAGAPGRASLRGALAAGAGLALAAVGVGLSTGRHFASLAARAPFVAALGAIGFAVARFGASPCRAILAGPAARSAALLAGSSGALVFALVDATVLPRSYPAFHGLAFALALASSALVVVSWRTPRPAPVPRWELTLGGIALFAALAACVGAPAAARRLAGVDDLRLLLDEDAPLLGRAVHVAAWLAPPAPVTAPEAAPHPAFASAPGGGARPVDWTSADILLLSVDALRADHLGAYGYGRKTTPNLDALARESAVFERAYCPTPSTSYSVTSLMTGKAMRPLLSLGLGRDSVTLATYLRRAGYATAAFYPPAIFYIDADRFTELEASGLGFEHRAADFASAEQRVRQVSDYLATAGPAPLLLWVHLYEPHEPYVPHAGYELEGESGRAIDLYDEEIAYTDAAASRILGAVRAARGRRPLVVVATADHGEEFGEHGGRYHGTTVYEEQVRVPLLVAGPGVTPRRVSTVVQTIDLLPTVLAAMGAATPPDLSGRDLGVVLAGADDPGLAYAETEDRTLLARGDDRLICARAIGACALYDVARDPLERLDRAAREPALAKDLRARTVSLERDLGRHERREAAWPDALVRGMQGEADAATDVAALLDDPRVEVRRKSAEVSFALARPEVAARLRAALTKEADLDTRRWLALAIVRVRERPDPLAEALVGDPELAWRRSAALAFALAGDPRGKKELEAWWEADGPSRAHGLHLHTPDAALLLTAIAAIHDADAIPLLAESLGYYPLRPRVAEALGAIGDARAKAPLLASFKLERYEPARAPEARALVALGAASDVLPPLTELAGSSDPMTEAIVVARDAGLLGARSSAATFEPARVDVDAQIPVPAGAPALRLWVLAEREASSLTGTIDGEATGPVTTTGVVRRVEVDVHGPASASLRVRLHDPGGVRAVWLVARRAGG